MVSEPSEFWRPAMPVPPPPVELIVMVLPLLLMVVPPPPCNEISPDPPLRDVTTPVAPGATDMAWLAVEAWMA
jgi:hypothetical protein